MVPMKRTLISPIFFCLLLFLIINPVKGDDVNLLDFPEKFGERLGISTFAAGLILSAILLMAVLLPLNLLVRSSGWLNIAIGFSLMGGLVAMTWLPVWVMLMIVLLVAGLYAHKIGKWLR